MDRSWNRGRTPARRLAALGAACLVGLGPPGLTPRAAAGAEPAATASVPDPAPAATAVGTMTWAEATLETRNLGKPTVLVVTSRAVPQSTELAGEILASPAVKGLGAQVNLAELCAEDEPEQIKRSRVSGYPTFIALRRGAEGTLEVAGSYRGSFSPEELAGWVRGLGLIKGPATSVAATTPDGGVKRASLFDRFHGHGNGPNPSPQSPTCPPPSPPKAPPCQPYCPPPYYPPPYYPPPTYPQAPPAAPREVYEVVEEEQPTEVVEVIEEAPRQVVVAQPRQVVVAQPRQVVVAQPREATTRNILTTPPTTRDVQPRDVQPRDVQAPTVVYRTVTAPPATRTVMVRDVEPAPRTVMVREAAPAPRTVMVREAAPAPREVLVRAAPRDVAPRRVAAQPALIQPGPLSRAVGRLGTRVASLGMPRVEVETQTTYRIAPSRESVVTEEAPPPPAAPPAQPPYCPPQPYYPPPYYPPPAPPWSPTPQQSGPATPQSR